MTTQSEYELEIALIKQLSGFGYEQVSISNEAQMLANLKAQSDHHARGLGSLFAVKHSDEENACEQDRVSVV